MCVVSMVYDHYLPKIGEYSTGKIDWSGLLQHSKPDPEMKELKEELKKLIKEFKEAVAAARQVDRLTGQPDCSDPDKAKLEERVAELEKLVGDLRRKGRRGSK